MMFKMEMHITLKTVMVHNAYRKLNTKIKQNVLDNKNYAVNS